MKVILSNEALADLEDVHQYIAKDSPRAAERMLVELKAACLDLAAIPLGYPVVVKRRRELRRRVCGQYLIFYGVSHDRIDVVRILHGARDYEGLLSGDD